jgi:hypothetical protein
VSISNWPLRCKWKQCLGHRAVTTRLGFIINFHFRRSCTRSDTVFGPLVCRRVVDIPQIRRFCCGRLRARCGCPLDLPLLYVWPGCVCRRTPKRGFGNTGRRRCVPGPQRFKYDRRSAPSPHHRALSFTLGALSQVPPFLLTHKHTTIVPPPAQPTPSQCLFGPPRRPPPTARLNALTAG